MSNNQVDLFGNPVQTKNLKEIKKEEIKQVKEIEKASKPNPKETISILPEKRKLVDPIRQTYYIEKALVERVKLFAYVKRHRISEVVNLAVEEYLEKNK
ncbi:hypothetical protein ACFL4A_02145 [bacterium]